MVRRLSLRLNIAASATATKIIIIIRINIIYNEMVVLKKTNIIVLYNKRDMFSIYTNATSVNK